MGGVAAGCNEYIVTPQLRSRLSTGPSSRFAVAMSPRFTAARMRLSSNSLRSSLAIGGGLLARALAPCPAGRAPVFVSGSWFPLVWS